MDKIILFGAGKFGRAYLEALGAESIFAFADNYSAGSQLNGKNVISFDELKNIASEYKIILSVGAKNAEAMMRQLEDAAIQYEYGPRNLLIGSGDYHALENEGLFTDEFVKYIMRIRPRTFANVGAAGGGYASIAAYYMARDAEIYLFEPVSQFITTLKTVFRSDKRVYIIEKAVSNNNGTIELTSTIKSDTNNIAHAFTIDSNQTMFADEYADDDKTVTVSVETVILDEYFKDKDLDLMLMDIEGAEVLAIEGMEKLIAERKTTFFLEVHEPYIKAIRPDGMEYINSVFKKYDYKIYWCELTENGNYKAERGGLRLVPSDSIRWEHCVISPVELKRE
jgi:FkbM family methyltransferase